MSQKTPASLLAEGVLRACQAIDQTAHVVSVLRDAEGRTSIHVRCTNGSPSILTSALNACYPIADISVTESLLDGVAEACVVVPSDASCRLKARQRAAQSPLSRTLGLLLTLFAGLAMLSYSVDVHQQSAALGPQEEL